VFKRNIFSFLFFFLLLSVEMEKKLKDAAENGRVEKVKEILRNNPAIDVNKRSAVYGAWYDSASALHGACANGHDSVVSLLLAHPDIDVNQPTRNGRSPFALACRSGSSSCVRLLLSDSRVEDLTKSQSYESTPLKAAASRGYLDIIRWWIASGREMDLGQPGDEHSDAIGKAMKEERKEVFYLLEKFKANPLETRSEVMNELGISGMRTILGMDVALPRINNKKNFSGRFPCDHSTQAD